MDERSGLVDLLVGCSAASGSSERKREMKSVEEAGTETPSHKRRLLTSSPWGKHGDFGGPLAMRYDGDG
jgi:hypothetical protein